MKLIPISKGETALVSDEDYERLCGFTWCLHVNRITGRKEAHRAQWSNGAMRMVTMSEDVMGRRDGYEVDHRDRNGLNNQRENLRWATRSQNMSNRGCWNSLGVKGVHFCAGKFVAIVWSQRKRYYLGRFRTKEEAAAAYDRKARELHGEFAVTNEQLQRIGG